MPPKLRRFYADFVLALFIGIILIVHFMPVFDNYHKVCLANYAYTDYPSLTSAVNAPTYKGKAVDPNTGQVYTIDNNGIRSNIKPVIDKHNNELVIKVPKLKKRTTL